MISPEILRRYPIFGVFDDNQTKALAMITNELKINKGAVLFSQNEKAETLYFLIDGNVDLFQVVQDQIRPENNKEFPVGEVNPGELFGLSTVIEPNIYTAKGIASQPSTVLAIDGVEIRSLIEKDALLGKIIIHQIAKQLIERLNTVRTQLVAAWL